MKSKSRVTHPIENLMPSADNEFWMDWLKRVSYTVYAPSDNLVKAHKKTLGRQSYCWFGSRLFWVWEFDEHRIFVANGYGMQMEVEPDVVDIDRIKGFMNAYLEAWRNQ